MMGLQRGHPSLLPSNMNMNSSWNQAAGTGEQEDGRISSRREGHQGGSPSDPLLGAGRFYPVQDSNDPEADDDSPISNSSALEASPFVQQQPFAASSGLQASTLAYNPVHGTPTALNHPSQERKRPPPSHPGQPLLHAGQPKQAEDHGQQNEAAAAGLDRKQPYNISDADPFISPHQSSLLANYSEDEGTPGASTTKRARANATGYYAPAGTPHNPPAAHLQPPSIGPHFYASWQQDDHFHHHHHYGHPPFEHYSQAPALAVYNFGNDQHPHGLGMHPPPPPPPAMPHSPPVPPSPLVSQPHQQHPRTSMTPPTLLPRRSSRPSSRAGAAAGANRDPVVNLARSVRAARAGEATVQAIHPTEEELSECLTPRARQALETWYQRLTELHMFKNQYGNCNVPQQYPENRQLGVWVNKQRMEKKNHEKNMRTSLTATKIANLNRLGFEWGKRKGDEAWQARYQELVEYRQTHGNCDVPTKYIANPALGRWVSTQRSQFKTFPNKHMTQERVNDLNDIGFRWCMMEQDVPSPEQQHPNETQPTHE